MIIREKLNNLPSVNTKKDKEIISDIVDIIHSELRYDYDVFIFGSRAGGFASLRSDFDIGIEGPAPVPMSSLAKISDKIDNLPTLKKVDIVDFKRADSSFLKIAKETAIKIG